MQTQEKMKLEYFGFQDTFEYCVTSQKKVKTTNNWFFCDIFLAIKEKINKNYENPCACCGRFLSDFDIVQLVHTFLILTYSPYNLDSNNIFVFLEK